MRKSTWLVLTAVIALFAWGVTTQMPARASAPAQAESPPGFGNKVAGCWVIDALNSANQQIQIFATLTSDGTYQQATTNIALGAGQPDTAGWIIGSAGTWVRTGPRAIHLSDLGMIFDGDGLHLYTFTDSIPIDFDADFETGYSDYSGRAYPADWDPLDTDAIPLFEWTGVLTVRKYHGD